MKVLVVGSGGREHTLVWGLSRDSVRHDIFCAPGNAGTAALASNLDIQAEDIGGLCDWAGVNRPDLTVVGPEAPLCSGLTDRLQALGFKVFGPNQSAARMEGSKVFSKDIMRAAGVPTAEAETFTSSAEAIACIRRRGAPIVVKAEGLAAGKGVFVCRTVAEAEDAVRQTLDRKVFGSAGDRLVVEEFLEGEEASILALVDGKRVVMLASAQDHKRIFDNDEGPNTGGMGAYSPAPVVTDALWPVIREQVFERTLAQLRREGIEYRGVLYAGLMIGKNGPKVLEFNCRFGDPETQVILPRLATDLAPALLACADGRLTDEHVRWRPEQSVCVVMASGGYPNAYQKGKVITGLDEAARLPGVVVFHAGTKAAPQGTVTSGGRVLGVTATGKTLREAVDRAYKAVDTIRFEGAHARRDIAARALRR
jgi:phosphoribosylamine--glycine ligase